MIQDLDGTPLPTRPVVPFVETAHDRIAIEIMRGCPWQCRFCQSTVIKRPLRYRTVETIVKSALESYHNTGYDEISLLSLSTSDYPHFEELVTRMSEVFTPLGVKISLPSLRITETLKKIPALLQEGRRSGLTLAPEVARDDMREQIRKPIKNEDLYEGCAEAFRQGWRKVKLYFMCGLPGEREADLDGIVEMAETIARIGKEVTGRYAEVTAAVSNFVPKPHTPYQWNGMKSRDYFHWAHRYLRSRVRLRSVTVKVHDIERSMLEGILTRGDRRVAAALEEAWSAGRGWTPGQSTSTPGSGGRRSRISGSTFRSTVTENARSTTSCPGTTFTSSTAATTLPRNRTARSSSSRRWPGRSESKRWRRCLVEEITPMATDVKTKLLTAEEFMASDLGEGTFELVRGEVIELPPPMPEHGRVCVNVAFALESYGRQTRFRLRTLQRFGGCDGTRTGHCSRSGRLFLQP